MMFAAILTTLDRLAGRSGRCLLVAACRRGRDWAMSAAPALAAAPKWHITMTHLNPFGLQAGAVPAGKRNQRPNHRVESTR